MRSPGEYSIRSAGTLTMSDQDNITVFPDLRRREAASKRPDQGRDAVDPILEALKSAPRNRDWYPIFARNLG